MRVWTSRKDGPRRWSWSRRSRLSRRRRRGICEKRVTRFGFSASGGEVRLRLARCSLARNI